MTVPGRPRLCFVGPMLGGHPGWVPSPAEELARLLRADGYSVRITSTLLSPLLRPADVTCSLIRRRRQIDVVVVLVFTRRSFAVADLASWLARRLGKRLVLWLHGGNLPRLAERKPDWVHRVLARGDHLVAPTTYLGEFAERFGGTVRIIPNLLRLDRYDYRRRRALRPRLLWMRTFQATYQPQMAVRVLASLLSRHGDATLTMAGQEQGLLGATRQLAASLGLADAVRFAGFLDPAGKRRELDRHDVFLNTNRIDNAPISVLEAAAAGVPVVTTEVGGIAHFLKHEHDALLVPDGDVEAMAGAVERLLAEPELAAKLSDNGRTLATSCSWPMVRTKWQSLFEEL